MGGDGRSVLLPRPGRGGFNQCTVTAAGINSRFEMSRSSMNINSDNVECRYTTVCCNTSSEIRVNQ